MKKILRRLLIASIGLLVGFFVVIGQQVPTKAAAGTKIYLTPSSSSVTTGNNFTYSIMIDTAGETVDAESVRLNYDQSKISFVSIDVSASVFTYATPIENGDGGIVSIDRGAYPAVSGNKEIAKVTFRANTAGTAAFSFNGETSAVRDGNNVLGTTSGATAVINGTTTPTPPPTPPPPPNPTPSPTPTPTPSSRGSAKPTTTSTVKTTQVSTKPNVLTATPNIQKTSTSAPNISNVKATVGFKSMNVSFSTDKPTRATVEYGLNSKLGLTTSDPQLKTEHSVDLDVSNLLPGETYYYRIKATTASGEVATTDTITVNTKGYAIRLLIKDTLGRPVANLPVTLRSEPRLGTTDAQGIVLFDDVAPGKHSVSATYKDKTYTKDITVNDTLNLKNGAKVDENSTIPVQNISIVLRSDKDFDLPLILLIVGALVGLGLLGLIGYWVARAIKSRHYNHPSQISQDIASQHSNPGMTPSPPLAEPSTPAKHIYNPDSAKTNSHESADQVDLIENDKS